MAEPIVSQRCKTHCAEINQRLLKLDSDFWTFYDTGFDEEKANEFEKRLLSIIDVVLDDDLRHKSYTSGTTCRNIGVMPFFKCSECGFPKSNDIADQWLLSEVMSCPHCGAWVVGDLLPKRDASGLKGTRWDY